MLALPLALIILAAVALCLGLAFALVHHSDMRHQQQQRASVVGVLDEFNAVFAELAVRRANEIAAMIRGARASDLAVLLVPSGLARYRHDAAYLLSHDGKLVAAFPPDTKDLPIGLARFAAAETDRPAGADRVRSDYVLIDDRPALATITDLGAVSASASRAPAAKLLTVARFGPHLLGTIERTAGVEALSLDGAPGGDDREFHSLVDRQGRIVGWLGWRTQHPMLNALAGLAPVLGLAGCAFFAFATPAFRRLSRATWNLAAEEAEARRIANEDSLTGLPNRRKILETLDGMLAAQRRGKLVCFGYLDLDGFKDINDAVGHQGGDDLLILVAERLRNAIGAAGTVGRLGLDEFAIVFQADSLSHASEVANDAVRATTRPFWIAGQALQVGLTVGLAHAPAHGNSRDELIRRADLALRAGKKAARGRTIVFEPAMEQELQDHRFVNRELRRTLAEGGLDVHYQPIVAADGRRIVGVEALLRWHHPERGDIPPGVFVPVAEQTGLMPKLGEFVLRRALTDALRWKDIYVAVNLSPVQVRDRALVDVASAVLAETGIAPGRVVLEITEGVLIDNPDEAQARLENLRALGVKIALDDFGSGYSSLSYLRRFPIDKLKIDKEFVAPLGRSANGGVIIQAIMALGRALGLTVLCEGVETEEQRVLLRLAGCDELQGYLFARPGPAQGIDRLMAGGAEAGRVRRAADA